MSSPRPRVPIARSLADTLLDVFAAAALLSSWITALGAWGDLPASVPVHFALNGEPDRWGSPYIVLHPSITVVLSES